MYWGVITSWACADVSNCKHRDVKRLLLNLWSESVKIFLKDSMPFWRYKQCKDWFSTNWKISTKRNARWSAGRGELRAGGLFLDRGAVIMTCIMFRKHVQKQRILSIHIDYFTFVIFPTADIKCLMKLPLTVCQWTSRSGNTFFWKTAEGIFLKFYMKEILIWGKSSKITPK